MAHIGRMVPDEAGMLHAMRPAHQILRLNPPGITTVCLALFPMSFPRWRRSERRSAEGFPGCRRLDRYAILYEKTGDIP